MNDATDRALTDTVLDAILDAHLALTLDDLDLVLGYRLDTPPDEDALDDALAELLELRLIAPRRIGPDDSPAFVLDLEVAP